MAPPKLSLLVLLFLLFPAIGNANSADAVDAPGGGFNITEILGKYPEFRLFNYLLGKTRVAREINRRNSVTVLAPANADVDWLLRRSARLPREALLELLSVHVILDYYDAAKIAALPRGAGARLVATTLYQTFGPTAGDKSGFLSIVPAPNGGARQRHVQARRHRQAVQHLRAPDQQLRRAARGDHQAARSAAAQEHELHGDRAEPRAGAGRAPVPACDDARGGGAQGGDPGVRAGAVAGIRGADDDGVVVQRRRGAGDGVRAGAFVGRGSERYRLAR